jgi:translation elongation factor EF-4
LLVDASQGIQAQTVANFYLAFGQGLHVIPVINKVWKEGISKLDMKKISYCLLMLCFFFARNMQIDLPGANPDKVVKQIHSAFELNTDDVLKVYLMKLI